MIIHVVQDMVPFLIVLVGTQLWFALCLIILYTLEKGNDGKFNPFQQVWNIMLVADEEDDFKIKSTFKNIA